MKKEIKIKFEDYNNKKCSLTCVYHRFVLNKNYCLIFGDLAEGYRDYKCMLMEDLNNE